jgi:spore coat protein A, manganese oxidase
MLLPIGLQRRGLAGDAGSPVTAPFQLPLPIPPVLKPVRSDSTTDYYELTQKVGETQILPGYRTKIFGYNGTYPGPTIKARLGRQSVVRQINQLPAGNDAVVHLHGMASLPQYDGYAEDSIPPGYYKDYVYPNTRAASLWYHDHALHKTAEHVYAGLAGLYMVQDDYELSLPLPKGAYDVSLLISDHIFAQNGSLVFDDQGHKGIMGDVISVNGAAWPRMEVANRKYRFRVLNGSIARSYRLALSTGDDFVMIGTDAGLRDAPVSVKNFRIAPAERYEFVLDFSKYPIGTKIVLRNLGLPNNDNFDQTNVVMRFDVVRQETDDSSIPTRLRPIEFMKASQAIRNRDFRFERSNGLWQINGKTWDKNRIDANPGLGDVEIWRLYNNGGGWFHPIHLHLADFQILDRNGKPPFAYERGWKDVFYVGENETVRVIGKFAPHAGKYMMHCHNSSHEDHDMMTQFEVGQGGPDPVTTAPARPLPAPPL